MGTNLQGYHLLWPDHPTFSQLQFTAPFTNTNRIIIIKGLAGFSIIQSTTNRMKPLRISFDENPCSALARRY